MTDMGGAPSILRTGLVLGLLSTLGPLAIDLYLPAFPVIGRELHASSGEVQRSLSIYFLAIAAGQIPWGSIGDRYGRKPPLYAGVAIFIAATIGCAMVRDPGTLIALRFVQGFGVCAATSVSRAIIRDLYAGHQAARLLAFSYLIVGISPMLAPLAGSLLLTAMGWRGLFWLLAVLGLGALALAAVALPESLPPERRRPIHPRALLSTYAGLLANRRFIAAATAAGLATTVPFSFLTAAPFLFSEGYGLTPFNYSLLLGLAAACSIGSTQLSPDLMRRHGPRRLLRATTLAGALLAAVLAVLALSGTLPLIVLQAIIMLMFVAVGLTLTPAAVTALDAAEAAGAAAALVGTMQLAMTAFASTALTLFAPRSPLPLASLLLAAWVTALGCAIAAFAGTVSSRRME